MICTLGAKRAIDLVVASRMTATVSENPVCYSFVSWSWVKCIGDLRDEERSYPKLSSCLTYQCIQEGARGVPSVFLDLGSRIV